MWRALRLGSSLNGKQQRQWNWCAFQWQLVADTVSYRCRAVTCDAAATCNALHASSAVLDYCLRSKAWDGRAMVLQGRLGRTEAFERHCHC